MGLGFHSFGAKDFADFRRKVTRRLIGYGRWLEYKLRRRPPEQQIRQESQEYWSQGGELHKQYSHWRGAGVFSEEERWLSLGRHHLEIYEEFARMLGREPPRRIVEWGCGGGANAVHFAPLAEQYVGIDISEESVAECSRQLLSIGFSSFVPVVINAENPESARAKVTEPCDLFLCTYVFELLPTPEYGLQVLSTARDMLGDGGMALIQIQYASGSWYAKLKRLGYKRYLASPTQYRIDEFWTAAEACGLKPRAVKLVPWQPLNDNGNYAYYLLTK